MLPFTEETLDYDEVAVEKNYVSITPIQFDLTNYKIIQEVKDWGLGKSVNGETTRFPFFFFSQRWVMIR